MLNELQVVVLSHPQNKCHVIEIETFLGFVDSIFGQK